MKRFLKEHPYSVDITKLTSRCVLAERFSSCYIFVKYEVNSSLGFITGDFLYPGLYLKSILPGSCGQKYYRFFNLNDFVCSMIDRVLDGND